MPKCTRAPVTARSFYANRSMVVVMARREHPPEVERLFDEARTTARGTPPRKHHLVPASYLRRWEERGRLRVTEIDGRKSYLTAAAQAARETDFYNLAQDQIDPDDIPPLLMETMLGRLEDPAKLVIDELIDHGRPERVEPRRMLEFVWYLSMQIVRGAAAREELRVIGADLARVQLTGISDEAIARRLRNTGQQVTPAAIAEHRRFLDDIEHGRVRYLASDAQLVGLAASSAEPLCEHLLFRDWHVYTTPAFLVTGDEPVVLLGGPGHPRGERAGVATAGVILFPLSPTRLLTLFHPDCVPPRPPFALDHIEVLEVNREILAAGTRWAFERPGRRCTVTMPVPPAPKVWCLRDAGVLEAGGGPDGRVFQFARPTRWAASPQPAPWPVARWWLPQ